MHASLRELICDLVPDRKERGEAYYPRALGAMLEAFGADGAVLATRNRLTAEWETLAALPAGREAPGVAVPDAAPERTEVAWVGLEQRRTLLFHWADGPAVLRLLLGWNGSQPPAWVEPSALRAFHAKLGPLLGVHFTGSRILTAKRQLEHLFDLLPVGIFTIGPDFILERANRSCVDQLHLDFSQVVGRKCFDVICRGAVPRRSCPLAADSNRDGCSEVRFDAGRDLHIVRLAVTGGNRQRRLIGFMHPASAAARKLSGALPANDFLRIYDQLSQPLTALTLLTELLADDPGATAGPGERELLRQQLARVVSILKQEKRACDRSEPGDPTVATLLEFVAAADAPARPRGA